MRFIVRLTVFLIIAGLPSTSQLLFASDTNANHEITIIKAETDPSDLNLMQIQWEHSAGEVYGAVFRLWRITSDPEAPLEVATLPGSATDYSDIVTLLGENVEYKLELYIADTLVTERQFTGLAARSGMFVTATGADIPNDPGGAIDIKWQLDPTILGVNEVWIYRSSAIGENWLKVGEVPASDGIFNDTGLVDGVPQNYMIRAHAEDGIYQSDQIMSITSHASWFNWDKINLLIIALFVLSAVTYYVLSAGKRSMYIRKIAGLQAVEEAVGRATEMGRSVLYIPGILDMDDVQTLAGLTILGSVAKMTAEYETRLDVPVSRSLVMSNGREVVKEAYLSVGRPDFYHEDIVHYVTDEQFGYVAAVDGIMVREKPAACFYLGAFFAESLILAETGNNVGAIQIAGTAMPSQLPFFVAACDYTLIGEELFAASAYLSGDQRMIASLRGQDVGKLLAMSAILFGALISTLGAIGGEGSFFMSATDWFTRLFSMIF